MVTYCSAVSGVTSRDHCSSPGACLVPASVAMETDAASTESACWWKRRISFSRNWAWWIRSRLMRPPTPMRVMNLSSPLYSDISCQQQADPEFLMGGGLEGNVSAPPYFIANAHNEPVADSKKKSAGGGRPPSIGSDSFSQKVAFSRITDIQFVVCTGDKWRGAERLFSAPPLFKIFGSATVMNYTRLSSDFLRKIWGQLKGSRPRRAPISIRLWQQTIFANLCKSCATIDILFAPESSVSESSVTNFVIYFHANCIRLQPYRQIKCMRLQHKKRK